MEKFGIFELLDTLSALTAAHPEENAAPRVDESPADAPCEAKPADAPSSPPADRPHGSEALAAFLARHDEVRRRAEKQK